MKEAGLEVRLNNFIIHDMDLRFSTAWNAKHTYVLIKQQKWVNGGKGGESIARNRVKLFFFAMRNA